MKGSTRSKVVMFGCALVCVTGCSRHPTALGSQIASADCVVATNLFGASAVFSGPQATQLVAAIKAAKLDAHQDQGVNSAASSSLRFMRGSNLLAQIMFDGDLLFTEEGRFVDSSGVLTSVWERIEKEHR